MVINMKRKRREECPSPLLDDSPKRTKVHAQRKFAQGTNPSPVLTPVVQEIESPEIDILPEPVELLPIKRPNTEDFLTFLCFRGTPILPPSLNFFNTASIVDTNGQVHGLKSESPKNGPIDTCSISKTGSGSSERPFIAFGVRKRADPIVISRQMDKKRRHALALQALRRKYQEQKMAKIRSVTISKLSEKPKTLLRSNSVMKHEAAAKKSLAVAPKPRPVPEILVKQLAKVAPRSVKVLRPQIKQKMCLRSFRGRFVQKELQFRNVKKRALPVKKVKKDVEEKNEKSDYSSDDERPLSKSNEKVKAPKVILAKVSKKSAPGPKKPAEVNFRITRSNKFLSNKIVSRRQQIKQRMLLTTPTIIKPRTLRSQTALKPRMMPEAKQKILIKGKKEAEAQKRDAKKEKEATPVAKKPATKATESAKGDNKEKDETNTKDKENVKKVLNKASSDLLKKAVSPPPPQKNKQENKPPVTKKEPPNVKKEPPSAKKEPSNVKKELNVKKEPEPTKKGKIVLRSSPEKDNKTEPNKAPEAKKKAVVVVKKNVQKNAEKKEGAKVEEKADEKPADKAEIVTSQRPTRKTKEAAAIYMEILSHKLVNESRIDDDNVSIDSFPELPNVKKTEQRENELKAKAKSTRTSESENDGKKAKPKEKEKEPEVVTECKVLRSSDKKKGNEKKVAKKDVGIDEEKVKKIIEEVKKSLARSEAKEEGRKSGRNETKEEGKKSGKNETKEEAKKSGKNETKEDGKKCGRNETKEDGKKSGKNETKADDQNNMKNEGKQNGKNEEKGEGKKNETKEDEKSVRNEGKQSVQNEAKEEGKKGVKDEEKKSVKNEAKEEEKKSVKTETKEEGKKNVKNEANEEVKKSVKSEAKEETCDRKTRSANQEKILEKLVMSPPEKTKEPELKVHINPIDLDMENKKPKPDNRESPKKKPPDETKMEVDPPDETPTKKPEKIEPETKKQVKRKPIDEVDESPAPETEPKKPTKKRCEDVDSDASEAKRQKKKEDEKRPEEAEPRRQTRNSSSQNVRPASDGSDESFRADVKIPRKKPSTRSKAKTENEDSSGSDRSTTSDVRRAKSTKNKKFTKTRGQQKEESFSDSDEEPLSKLTQNKKESEEKPKESEESFVKPKRECAKRPQNYLPMFSSSEEEEDDYFHGFKESNKSRKITETCAHLPTTSDLSCKDVGRRFGKGKVNMSTEQIEKWLKDSAMAGNSVTKENDAMLKFGEKIPTETSHSLANLIDTDKLKKLLIPTEDKAVKKEAKADTAEKRMSKQMSNVTPIDRKLIFRNKTKGTGVNVKAFSANNETSVYAFEETEDMTKTPFRRPARRPSSTATSKSEEEAKLEELPKSCQFRRPSLVKQDKSKDAETTDEKNMSEDSNFNKPKVVKPDRKTLLTAMTPPSKPAPHVLDDAKYKVPSSPSASSSSSAKLSKRQTAGKYRAFDVVPVKLPEFPAGGGACGQLVEAPTFHPSEKEFQDPLEYIEKIRAKAEPFGICRIVPPSTFKPECKVTDDMRFTAYNQYVHKMLHRWGPNFKELMAIQRYLSTQNISLTHPPWIGGMEIDLPRLYQTVQSLGGLKEVIEKKKWPKVSDIMKIPKSAQDRVTKLDDIYCKYLLPYDTLSPAEREKLFDEVETEWAKRESKTLLKAQQNIEENSADVESESEDEAEECIVKGRSMALNAFYRIARNTMSMWFKNPEPPAEEVEHEFWKHVTQKQNHICVHSGSIDSGNWGYGFAVSKNSPFARHAWNLKVLTNNSGSVLRAMGPVMGVTVPTLHVGMVFSSCCWYRDPHSLPWIEYLHTGGSKIWYGIPNSTAAAFHSALKTIVPNYCRNKGLWLPSDTVMVPPNLLVENGVSLCRIAQEPGQFVVVFPKVFTSSLSTGYVVSESVYFAPPYWLHSGREVFDELRHSCEPSMFSFDRLLLSVVNDSRSSVEVLRQIIPAVQELCDTEKAARERAKGAGVSATERLPLPETAQVRKKKRVQSEDGEYECEICRMNLFVSMVSESQDDAVYCLDHAVEQIERKKIQGKHCKLEYTYDEQELDGLVDKVKAAIAAKLQKKIPSRFAGMPTLLK